MKQDYELIKENFIHNLLFEEEVRIFYENGLITEDEYNDIITKNKRVE